MRLYFILSEENLFHPNYFKGVLDAITKNKYKIVGVTVLKENYKKGILYFLWQQLNLWGALGFFYIATHSLLRTLFTRLNLERDLTIENISKNNHIPLTYVKRVNSEEHLDYLRRLKIDIIISSGGQIFKKDLLKLPRIACVNRHSGLLPKYGGAMPVFWAMLNNEKKFGITIHHMVEDVDKGDVIYQKEILFDKDYSLFKNYLIAFKESVGTTINALNLISEKTKIPKTYSEEESYFSFPTISKMREFGRYHKAFSIMDIFFYRKIFKFYE